MEIERHLVHEESIESFAEKHGFVMVIRERCNSSLPAYFAYFKGCEIKAGCTLRGAHGDGNTEGEAIANYCKEISCRPLVFDAFGEHRLELTAPRLFYAGGE